MNIGEKIKELRLKNGETQASLAEKLNIQQNALSYYENNIRPIPEDILEKLSEIFDVELSMKKEYIIKDKNQKKYLIGCISNNLRNSNFIKTRFFLIDNDKIEDVTKKLCEGVTEITNYEYKNGLANYNFGCGLSHYLQERNLDKVTTLELDNTKLMMLTLEDVKYLLNVNSVFDIAIEQSLINYIKSRGY